jgi:hypothetical protein
MEETSHRGIKDFEDLKRISVVKALPPGHLVPITPVDRAELEISEDKVSFDFENRRKARKATRITNLGGRPVSFERYSVEGVDDTAVTIEKHILPFVIGPGLTVDLHIIMDRLRLRARTGSGRIVLVTSEIDENGEGRGPSEISIDFTYEDSLPDGPILNVQQDLDELDIGTVPLFKSQKFSYLNPQASSVALVFVNHQSYREPIPLRKEHGAFAVTVALEDGKHWYYFLVDDSKTSDPHNPNEIVKGGYGTVNELDLTRFRRERDIIIENIGNEVLEYSLASSEPWLKVDQIKRRLEPLEAASVDFQLIPTEMRRRNNEGFINIISNTADAENRRRAIKVKVEGAVAGPHLKIQSSGEIEFEDVLRGEQKKGKVVLANEGDGTLEVDVQDTLNFLRGVQVKLQPGEERDVDLLFDSMAAGDAGVKDWEISFISNTDTYPFQVQKMRCRANLITMDPSEKIPEPIEVFFWGSHQLTVSLRRSDHEPIKVAPKVSGTSPAIRAVKVSDDQVTIHFDTKLHSGLEDEPKFEVTIRDKISGVLMCMLPLRYRIIKAKAEISYLTPERFRTGEVNTIEAEIRNVSDEKLVIFSVQRRVSPEDPEAEPGTERLRPGKKILEPFEATTVSYDLVSASAFRRWKYWPLHEEITVETNDGENTTAHIEKDFSGVPFFDRRKRVATFAATVAFGALYVYQSLLAQSRGVNPLPSNVFRQILGKDPNTEKVAEAYHAMTFSGPFEVVEALLGRLGNIANSDGRDAIEYYRRNVGLLRQLKSLVDDTLSPVDRASLLQASDSLLNELEKMPYPATHEEEIKEHLINCLVAEVRESNKVARELLTPENHRTSEKDDRAAENLNRAAQVLGLAGRLRLDNSELVSLHKDTEALQGKINKTSYVDFDGVPAGSTIYLNGTAQQSSSEYRYIVEANTRYSWRATHRLHYDTSGDFNSAREGVRTVVVRMRPREGTIRWRPVDGNQPDIVSVTCSGRGANEQITNGTRLVPGSYEFVFRFSNGGRRTYDRTIRSLEYTDIVYECNMGTVVVVTRLPSTIYRLREGQWQVEGRQGRAEFMEYYGECEIKIVPDSDNYAVLEETITVRQEREVFERKIYPK